MRCALLAALLLSACGDDAGQTTVDAPGGGSADAAIDGTNPDAPLVCGSAGPAEMMCGTECIDTSSDPKHCGSCTMMCGAGCAASQCVLALDSANGAYSTSFVFGSPVSDAGIGIVADTAGNITLGGFFGPGTIDFGGGNTLTGAAGDNAWIASFTGAGVHRWSKRLSGT